MLSTSLEIARGLAALWVFVYHLRFGLDPGAFRRLADAGFLGVPLFFVISGYCMMASSRGIIAKQKSAGTFLRRRLRRIFPPFWASILVVLAIPFLAAAIYSFRYGGYRWPAPGWYSLSLGDWFTLSTLTKGLLWVGPAHKPYSAVNPVYWSLAIEVQFYLVMALGLLFRRWFYSVLLATTVGCLVFWRFGPAFPGMFPQYWPMFALGLLLYAALDRGFSPARLFGRWAGPISGIAFTVLLAAALGLSMYVPSESLERQTLFAVFCALVFWAGSGVELPVPKDLFASRALVGLGKMSYSVYLLHIQLVSLVTILFHQLVPRTSFFAPAFYVLSTLILVYVFYRFCEKRYATSPSRPR